MAVRVTVWGENVHERSEEHVRALYPEGMHGAVAAGLDALLGECVRVRTATLDHPSTACRRRCWRRRTCSPGGGIARTTRSTTRSSRACTPRCWAGMGLLALHSAHYSKIFTRLLGTSCSLRWRNAGERELVWTVDPAHPIAAGVPQPIVIDAHEMYGEPYDIPAPDELVFISSFAGGEVFRGGCCFRRGRGRIFYFSPGDQDYPVYHHPDIQRVLANATLWAAPTRTAAPPGR
jgi:trehalose utilization protein